MTRRVKVNRGWPSTRLQLMPPKPNELLTHRGAPGGPRCAVSDLGAEAGIGRVDAAGSPAMKPCLHAQLAR